MSKTSNVPSVGHPAVHGTRNAYTNYFCRCADCKAAMAAYQRAWRARREQK